jgi:hypothetical protein
VLRGEEPDAGGFEFTILENADGLIEGCSPAYYSYADRENSGRGVRDGVMEKGLVGVSRSLMDME